VSHRPLVLFSGLAVGDYLLWNWSLNANHEVIALVSGLTLPPLALAAVWLLALAVARLLARSAFRGRMSDGHGTATQARAAPRRRSLPAIALEESPGSSSPAEPRRKIAA
jgi:hypothetical protein